ncbi:hypothetical protein FO488_05025 [Geobacter sp. FeAm09]|uniref:hypothetical protein n=1 Tax=Geobacter sp. FeAm09 TaxID=2597769 RepID=UPI0011EC9E93|nr:hypothetical protein [Geobacter sp. FeAm09]QEM67575.1 hypothetical protein FO488_05025 [Geobacter sp. FeAm09]
MIRRTAVCTAALALAAGSAWGYGIPEVSRFKLDCDASVRALAHQGYKCTCSNEQLDCGGKPAAKQLRPPSVSQEAQMKSMIVGGIFQGLIANMGTSRKGNSPAFRSLMEQHDSSVQAARKAEERRRAEEAEFQAERDRALGAYKGLEGASALGFKDADSGLDFKTLDGGAETMAAAARQPFDTAVGGAPPVSAVAVGRGTPFFGETMPETDLRLLADPENDPRVVDLRNAVAYTAGNLKEDGAEPVPRQDKEDKKGKKAKGEGEPIIEPPDCAALSRKLGSFLEQRNKFHTTILLAQNQVDEWAATNRGALVNAAKDGIEYFTGNLLEALANRGKAAERLQEIYTRNASRMAAEWVDILALEAKIRRLQFLSSAGKAAEVAGQVNDWQTFVKDGMSALLAQLTSSNQEVREILEDPKVGKYFQTESPELNALLDISKIAAANRVFGSWVKKQLPVIGLAEISLKQLYNGTEWAASFYRLAKANDINGNVMESAKALQRRIDDTRIALKACR